jgi:4-hydroxysphinganine ceramide fatty acyl 2-hydroxylase
VTDLGLTRGTDIAYDCIHFWSHHLVVKTGYFAEMKAYHLSYVVTLLIGFGERTGIQGRALSVLSRHHYQNFDLGYGVTSKFWDYVFGTVLPMEVK